MSSVNAQVNIKGTVIDSNNEPLIGATIAVKGTQAGTNTDAKGNFELTVPDANSTLLISYIGYKNQEVVLAGQTYLQIRMEADVIGINEIVVVGYGTQKRSNVTSAISNIKGEDLRRAPVSTISNMLRGTVPGIVSLQQSGQPGSDNASLLIRGVNAKYIVDGVQREINEIDPNEIESVSVLKDAASAAVYGLDANAVVIVTTRRGVEAPSLITFTGGYGVSDNAVMLEMLDGPEYAYWYNKAREMDGDDPIFSAAHVALMKNNDPTDGWGNTEWYKKTFGIGTNMNMNLNVTGGTDRIKYFVSLGEYSQKGNVKNFNYNRISLRSNIDAKIAKNLDVTFDVSGRVEDRKRPGYTADPDDWNNVPQQAIRALPFVPATIDGVPVSTRTASSYVNPLAASELTGYGRVKTSLVQTNFALNYKVPFINGLSAKFMTAYDISFQTSKNFSKPYYTYVANAPLATTEDISYNYTYDARGTGTSLSEGLAHYEHLTTNTSLKYENRFGLHNVSALALFETVNRTGNSFSAKGEGFDFVELDELDWESLPDKRRVYGSSYTQKQAGFVGRISYDYNKRYLAEVATRYDGSYVFSGMENRWGFFPSGSLGWRISEEDWFSSKFNFVDELKLRGSAGLTSTSYVPPYYYLNTLSFLDNPAVVLGGEAQNGLVTSTPANINLTWAKALQYDFGFNAVLWDGLLGVDFDAFYKYEYDILGAAPDIYPASYGGYFPGYVNNDKKDYKGFEIALSHRSKIGDFSYGIQVSTTYTKRRWLRCGYDAVNTPDYLKLTGKEAGAQVGFIAEGLFQSQDEIDNSPLIVGKDVRIGDIKYKDRNGDGIISYDQDRGYIGKSAYPKFEAGLSFNCAWKGFDASFLIQGALGRDVALTGVYESLGIMDNTSMTKPFYHGGNSPQYLVENSWTEENTNAEFPRLSIVPASSNNAFSSTFWYRNGDYIRLKNFQIGYTFPKKWIDPTGINSLRIYAEGQNVFTLSKLTKYGIDPEQPGVSNGFYPQQRVMTMGLKLVF